MLSWEKWGAKSRLSGRSLGTSTTLKLVAPHDAVEARDRVISSVLTIEHVEGIAWELIAQLSEKDSFKLSEIFW